MKPLFFLAHPAHYHLFKHIIKYLKENNKKYLVVIKSKDILEQLLINEDIPYKNILTSEKKGRSKISILYNSIKGLLIRDLKLAKIVRKEKSDLLIGTDWSIVHVGFFLRKPSIAVNEDDTIATPENKYFYPMAKTLLLPSCCDKGKWLKKRVTYNSYHELAYLHPNHFTPNIDIVKQFNPENKPFVIIRLVKLTASHDIGKEGIDDEILDTLINSISKKYEIFITSEKKLTSKYEKYRITLNPIHIHHALYYANLFIGDSQTMAAEAGVLGTPFIRVNDFVGKIGYLDELENKYQLGFGFKTNQLKKMLIKVEDLVTKDNLKTEWKARHEKMLKDKIDFAQFQKWFFTNYPESLKIMKENPEYQNNFK